MATTILSATILLTTGCREDRPQMMGMVEAREVVVASKLAGRLAEVSVEEGDTVRAGDAVARIAAPEVSAKMEQAKGAARGAEARLQMARHGARPEEIRMATAALEQAVTARELAEKTWKRIEKLLADSALAQQQADEARTRWQAAVQTEDAARARLEMVKSGARPEEIEGASGLYDQARNALEEARIWQDETLIRSPVDGIVQKRYLTGGEIAAAGSPIVVLVRPSEAWVALTAREDQLASLKLGTEMEGEIPALGRKGLKFRVTWMTAMGDFATWRSTSRTGDQDLRSFEVRLTPVSPIPGLLPGMTVRF